MLQSCWSTWLVISKGQDMNFQSERFKASQHSMNICLFVTATQNGFMDVGERPSRCSNAGFLEIKDPFIKGAQIQLEEYARFVTLCQPSRNLRMSKFGKGTAGRMHKRAKPSKVLALSVNITSLQTEYSYGVLVPAEFCPSAEHPLTLQCIQRVLFDKVSSAGAAQAKIWLESLDTQIFDLC